MTGFDKMSRFYTTFFKPSGGNSLKAHSSNPNDVSLSEGVFILGVDRLSKVMGIKWLMTNWGSQKVKGTFQKLVKRFEANLQSLNSFKSAVKHQQKGVTK